MGKEKSLLHNESLRDIQIPALGFEMMRQLTIPEVLGEDTSFVLYYLGKKLARQYPLQEIEDIQVFFHKAGFGHLNLVKQKKKKLEFELKGPLIEERFSYEEPVSYRLEAGFIAQQLSLIFNDEMECIDEENRRKKLISFYAVETI
ncbi:DUF2507 domain-containing protein [Virgibacillus sp. MSP4-1]|uniref:DUF2507 domain-containing protein n=1 Tax=Virgibacillus sp. MSP4-1 TaxID=2700081 RepID=UPI0003A64139|nr:DUF2507 domain-containing protein [Virgibacillus sp. MSP4-1]QHS22947.1 DUF2507 domain-containing protein [Virgibacillus sp. MSP4-1]